MLIDNQPKFKTQFGKFDKKVMYIALASYWWMSKKYIKMRYNGVGPNHWLYNWIPKKIRDYNYRLNMKELAYIHDCGYDHKDIDGWDLDQYKQFKKQLDEQFEWNGTVLIEYTYVNRSGWMPNFYAKWLKKKRLIRLEQYCELLDMFGDSAFWSGKIKPKK